jgi:hypothetical protein
VARGQQIDGMKIALTRGGVITGRVFEPGGEPAVDAIITLHRVDAPPRDRAIFWRSDETSRTNARGEFRLWGLAPGDYLVAASARSAGDGWFSSDVVYAPIWFPDTNDAGQAQRISVSAGQVRDGIDSHVVPVTRVTVSGIVVGAATPVSGAITVDARARELTAPSLAQVVGTSVDASGRFILRNVLPGDYWIRASRNALVRRSDPLEPAWGMTPVSVAGADVKNVVVPLQPWLSVSGVIRLESSMPGMDASLLSVDLFPMEGSLFEEFTTGVIPEPSGAFVLAKLKPARYRLDVTTRRPGVLVTVKTVEIGGRVVSLDAITLEPGQSLSDVVIVADVRGFVP